MAHQNTENFRDFSNEQQVELARTYCFRVAQRYWESFRENYNISWEIRPYTGQPTDLPTELMPTAHETALDLSTLEPKCAGYQLSIKYMELLPKAYREKFGIYYTPMKVVKAMLEAAKCNDIDLKTARIVDTASGGSAFLAPLCCEMKRDNLTDQAIVEDIVSRLTGFEIDPFAAWLSQFLIDCELALIAPTAKMPKKIVHCANALTLSSDFFGCYDYVIGNPPYGKISPSDVFHERYSDIISGAPNLYQLFYKLAFLLVRQGGFVHLITPTGFIGGKYFKALRSYIENHASAVSFSFFKHRTNIFRGVQQELVISLFKKPLTNEDKKTAVNAITMNQKSGNLSISPIGSVILNKQASWVLPKTAEELSAAKLFESCQHFLAGIGYVIRTGHVVPHRSDGRLSNEKGKHVHPMIWSEAIQNTGFKPNTAYSKGRFKWYRSEHKAGLVQESSILIKRTSSKEQARRIHAALVDQHYILKHGGFYAENHVNVLKAGSNPCVDLDVILRLLKTRILDLLFRCISGTITVSSSELNQLPMPSPSALRIFAQNTHANSDSDQIEHAARIAYGL